MYIPLNVVDWDLTLQQNNTVTNDYKRNFQLSIINVGVNNSYGTHT